MAIESNNNNQIGYNNGNIANDVAKLPLVIAIIIAFVTVVYIALVVFLCKRVIRSSATQDSNSYYNKLNTIAKKNVKYFFLRSPSSSLGVVESLPQRHQQQQQQQPIYKATSVTRTSRTGSTTTTTTQQQQYNELKVHQSNEKTTSNSSNNKKKGNFRYQHNKVASAVAVATTTAPQSLHAKSTNGNSKKKQQTQKSDYRQLYDRGGNGGGSLFSNI